MVTKGKTGRTIAPRLKRNRPKWFYLPFQPAGTFSSEAGNHNHHNPMFEDFIFVTRSPLAYPEMVRAATVCEMAVERRFHAL